MNYTLVTPQGRIYTFYIEATALCFQQAYGGVLFSQRILEVDTAVSTVDSK